MKEFNYESSLVSIKQEYYLKGLEDGKIKSTEDSLESGFREGVSSGIEHGYHSSFIETIRQFAAKDAVNIPQYKSKLDKITSAIDSTNKDDIDMLKTKIKQIKANLKLIYNKN